MPTVDLNGVKVSFDGVGYLEDPKNWMKEASEYIAGEDGVSLTEDHWKVIKAAREYFDRFGCVEMPHMVCKDAGLEKQCITRLFNGSITEYEKIAGLFETWATP
ncbi:MAG: TusE/DsrC/DsvC family sulfur relay protein [Nitrospirae bacterium]|nr:TusE/DsrC/DsvC family sulfur relay protein [Nitrospirota bacterium]